MNVLMIIVFAIYVCWLSAAPQNAINVQSSSAGQKVETTMNNHRSSNSDNNNNNEESIKKQNSATYAFNAPIYSSKIFNGENHVVFNGDSQNDPNHANYPITTITSVVSF